MLWSISWRNVWRNKVRSLVVVFAVMIGLVAGVFSTSFMKGWIDQRMESVLHTELSYIQVHHEKFNENFDFKYQVKDIHSVAEKIRQLDGVNGVAERIIMNAMAASAETGTGVQLSGVYPEQESMVNDIHDKIVEGAYFEGVSKNPVVIGEKLADKMNVGVRNKIVITLQDEDGNITSGAFRIAGIYRTDNNSYDGMHVFVRYNDLAELAEINPSNGHEIAVNLDQPENIATITTAVEGIADGYLTENWKTLSPEMAYMDDLMQEYMFLIIIIILFALSFGIINTMLMAVLERVKELGMLMSIGMNKRKVFGMLMLESIMLTITGGILGIILGYALSIWFGKHPIDVSMWGDGLREMGFSPVIYTSIDYSMMIPVIILVILTGIVSSLYPAYKAIKLNPVEATKID